MRPFMVSFLTLLTIFFLKTTSHPLKPYNAIFAFGDSLTDTGNYLLSGAPASRVLAKLPYGITFFHYPSGRACDGRLVIDFFAQAYGLPFVPPYLERSKGRNFTAGANFAIVGATALDPKFFADKNLSSLLPTNISLNRQLKWFQELKPSLCASKKDCEKYLGKSLILLEIGGNDYNVPLVARRPIEEVRTYVPLVIKFITAAVTKLIEEGARELVVPGILPSGCIPLYLTIYQSPSVNDYDQNGCLKDLNIFSQYHNLQLKIALNNLRSRYPHVRIIYADLYGAVYRIIRSLLHYGFKRTLKACCGGGGPYNFNSTLRCGDPGSAVCVDPSTQANWDGIHFTDATYGIMATSLLEGVDSYPPMRSPNKQNMV